MSENSRLRRFASALQETWRKLSESYAKHLPYTYILLLLTLPSLFFSLFYADWVLWPLAVVFGATALFHTRIVVSSAREMVYPERIIRLEQWRLSLFRFSIPALVVSFLVLWGLAYTEFRTKELPFPFNQIANFSLSYFLFFLFVELVMNARSFQTPYRMAKLCFRVTTDKFEKLLRKKTESVSMRVDDAHRCFKWLKLGFQSCNDLLIRKPYLVKVKNIEQYHQHIVGFTLVASTHADIEHLKAFQVALQQVLESLGKIKPEFSLSRFLIALQLILGKRVKGEETSHTLVDMLLIRPSLWDRTKVAIRAPYIVLVVSIAALVVTFLQLVFQLSH